MRAKIKCSDDRGGERQKVGINKNTRHKSAKFVSPGRKGGSIPQHVLCTSITDPLLEDETPPRPMVLFPLLPPPFLPAPPFRKYMYAPAPHCPSMQAGHGIREAGVNNRKAGLIYYASNFRRTEEQNSIAKKVGSGSGR